MANIFDPVRVFSGLKRAVAEGVEKTFPVETSKRILRVSNVTVDDSKADPFNYKLQKEIKVREGDYVAPVYGDLELVDKETGQVIDKRKKFRLMDVPVLTDRYSYILGGNEYTVDKQLRMKPGIYTREKENGELESQFNLAKGGRGFKMLLNPEDNVFKLKIQTANPPLYPILKALGIEDGAIREAWGEKLFKINQDKTLAKAENVLMKAYKSIFGKDASTPIQAQVELKKFFEGTVLSEETTQRTLGKGFASVTPDALLATSHKLLKVSRGEEEPDDRDSMVFKHIYDAPDLVQTRIDKSRNRVQYDVKRVMDKKDKINEIVSKDMLNKPVRAFFVQGTVAAASEQTNPTTILAEATKVTSLGEGAIGDMNAITDSMRAVNPSHIGVLDPLATPECFLPGTQIYTKNGWKNCEDITMSDEVLCRPLGDISEKRAVTAFAVPEKVVSYQYSGDIYGMDNDFIAYQVTPEHRVLCCPNCTTSIGYRINRAEDVHGHVRRFQVAHAPVDIATPHTTFSLPPVAGYCRNITSPVDMGDWAEFMGWYLSEGCASINTKATMYNVRISQDLAANPDVHAKIGGLLKKLPYGDWHARDREFSLCNKQLNTYLKQFGYCQDKYIPEYIFSAPVPARQRFFDAMLLGDGRVYSNRKPESGIKSYEQLVYTTTSPKLAEGFDRLATGLGYSVRTKAYRDKRSSTYLPVYEIRMLKVIERVTKPRNYFVRQYSGRVYCVTVPGGLVLARLPGKVALWIGNSEKIGVNLHLALGANIKDKEFQTMAKDVKTGKTSYMNVKDLFDKNVAFPDQYDSSGKPKSADIAVVRKGKHTVVASKEVDYVLRSPKQMFSYLSNLVPFLGSIQGNRGFMANKMLGQAIPLKNREEPLVQTKMPTGDTFEKFIGKNFSVISKTDGKVTKLTEDVVEVTAKDGSVQKYNLFNNFPLNNKSFIHSESKIALGQSVKEGDVLADSVYTKNGTLAIGTNLRMGVVPFRDSTFEDGYVISESAAKKLTSEHLREVSIPISRDDQMDLKKFKAHYPTAMSASVASKLDADGVIKVGATVEPGDTVIAHLQKLEILPEDAKLGKLSKSLVKGFRNNAQVWDKETTGRVVDVVRNPDSIKVYIRTEEPMQIGDKLVNRYGAKGIVSSVVPDKEMPHDKQGRPLEVAVSPSAIPGRINPSQILEAAASKVAVKRGRPLKIDNFADYDSVSEVKKMLKENGLTDKEEFIDPTTGQSMGKLMTGQQYYLKLMHQVSKKINARGVGPTYDIDKQPTKGGHTSARAMDRLTWNGLIAHGARENLYEMTAYKAEDNPELWRNVKLGLPLPAPKTPFVFDKLTAYLAAGGVNVRKDGNKLYLMPLTDKEVLERSNGAIDEAKVVVAKNLRPVKDGLFDEVKTGGLKGTKWTHIPLAEPMLNPAMENAAKTVLGLSQKQLDGIISGTSFYNKDSGKVTDSAEGNTVTAGTAIKEMLKGVNVDKRYDELRAKAKNLSGQGLDKANKELRFLRALKQFGMRPDEAYILNNVPVLPPQFRPMYPLPNGSLNTAPINYLYRDMVMVNSQLKELGFLDDGMKSELRGDLYKAVKALQGLGDPLVARGERRIAGAIEFIKGPQPKSGFFQSAVFSKNQDLSGSSTVTPSTEMNPDELMLPRDMAWDLYQPFIVQEMTKMGYKPLDAHVAVKNHAPQANLALERAVRDRPVWVNRAPSLHKFSVLAMQPKLYDGKSIRVHPLVVGGLNMDFDGDTAGIYVPISNKAVEEAKNFLPTRVLEHAADQRIMLAPSHDIMTGLYYITKPGKDVNKSFGSMEEAMKEYKTKSIEIYDNVTIAGKKTSIGRELVSKHLPQGVMIPTEGLTKATIKSFLKDLSKAGPDAYRNTMDALSKLSAKYNLYSEVSIGLDDITPDAKSRDAVLAKALKEYKKAKTDDERRDVLGKYLPEMNSVTKAFAAANTNNALSKLMAASGKPSFDQFKQLISTPFAVSDDKGNAVPLPLTKSFAEGLPVSEYWYHTYGSRTGMIQKKMETAEPGYFAKQVISATLDNVITKEDCGTNNGVDTSLDDANDVLGRYVAGTNALVTDDYLRAARKDGKKTLKLRSPLTCDVAEGTCAMCYGLRENGQKAKIGDNVGALAGQFFTEPTTQGAMKRFHTGAVLGAGAQLASGLERLQQLTLVPKFLKDKATLASLSGKVEKIEDNPGGGQNVYVNGEKHLVGVHNKLKVGYGDKVERGDAISDGPIKPQELLALKGIEPTQRYLVDSMKETFKGMGNEMSRKLLETVVRSTTNLTQVEDPGNHPYYVPGDTAPLTEVLNWNKNNRSEIDVDLANGLAIAAAAGPYKEGTVLDKDKVKALKTLGIEKVLIKSSPIRHTPSIVGVDILARMGKDWLAKLNTNHIEQLIVEGAQEGDVSAETSFNPTGPYVLARTFGKAKGGKY